MSGPVQVDADLLRAWPLPEPDEGGGKEERGRVLVVGGSLELPGAVLLAGTAALRAGAGKLQIGTVEALAPPLGLMVPEARVVGLPETSAGGVSEAAADRIVALASSCRAVLLGPGLPVDEHTAALTRLALEQVDGPPIVLDAAAIMRVGEHRDALARHRGRLILTPHAGEAAGMLGADKATVEADPIGTARRASAELGAIFVLKGRCTFIAGPDGRVWSSAEGNVGLATSGSGDTLAGLMAGLLARGAGPAQAAIWAVYLHAKAGERLARRVGPLGYLAREIPDDVPRLMAELRPSGRG